MSDSKMPRKETFSDQPLSTDEIPRAASLLLRAVKHGQAQQILGAIKEAPGAKRSAPAFLRFDHFGLDVTR